MICSSWFFLLTLLGGVLHPCKADESVEFENGNVQKRLNNPLESLDTSLPTRDDITGREVKLDKNWQTLKNEMAMLSKKLELLQSDVQYLVSLTKYDDNKGQQTNNRRMRRSFKVPDFVASDYRLGILISEIQSTSLNESCKFVDQLVAVEKEQFAVLEEIRNTTSQILQTRCLELTNSVEFDVNNTNQSIVEYEGTTSTVESATPRTRQERYFTNPILDEVVADPCIIKINGSFYLVYTQGDRIDVLKSPILSNFRNVERKTVYVTPPNRSNLWAPELHLIRGGLYMYFTMDDGLSDENHRMYVIQALDPNNPMGQWSREIRLLPQEDMYAIDGTVLQYGNGELYFIWSGYPNPRGSMNLYIAQMESPTRIFPPRTLLRAPTMNWEKHGYPINQGAFIILNEGRTFLVFSASSSYTPNYCLGIMGIDELKDPLVPDNWWNDVHRCVFKRNDAEGVFATGHASFVRSLDDSELWMVYHATDNANVNRINPRARIQKIEWNPDKAPKFPTALGINREIKVPSGEYM